jgi:hypothetical protein
VLIVDLQISTRTALVLGPDGPRKTACGRALAGEGVRLLAESEAEQADIVVVLGHARPGSDLLDDVTVDDLYASWDGVVDAIAAYHRALPHMEARRWGRFVWVGTASSRSLEADRDDLDLVATLGMRALHKVIAFDEGPVNVLANSVLSGAEATDDDVAAAVTFLCSEGAGYLTGVTLTVDGGVGAAMF